MYNTRRGVPSRRPNTSNVGIVWAYFDEWSREELGTYSHLIFLISVTDNRVDQVDILVDRASCFDTSLTSYVQVQTCIIPQ